MEDNRTWTLVRLGSKSDRRVVGTYHDRGDADLAMALLSRKLGAGLFVVTGDYVSESSEDGAREYKGAA